MPYHPTVLVQFILLWVSDSSDIMAMEFFCVLIVSLSLNYVFLEDDMSCNMRIKCRVVQFGSLTFSLKMSKFSQAL